MLEIHDIRKSRVFQEAKAEGEEIGIEKGIAIAIAKMAAKKMSAKKIAATLEVDEKLVRQIMAEANGS